MILLLKRGQKAIKSYNEAQKEYQKFRLYKKGAEQYWIVNGNHFIGRVAYRKTKTAGEVVYDVRPSERGKGYGKLMLKMFLVKMKKQFKKLEIVCRTDNTASQKIIMDNGGRLVKRRNKKLFYVIEIRERYNMTYRKHG